MPYRYILEYVDGTYDVGSTWHVLERAQQHNDGLGSTYTHGRLPVELVNCEEYPSFAQAFGREQQVQGWSRRRRRALIEGRQADLPGIVRLQKTRSPERVSDQADSSPP